MAIHEPRSIWAGDNLQGLNEIVDGTVALAYLDPPFGSGRSYDAFLSATRAGHAYGTLAFDDHWQWDENTERSLDEVRSITTEGFGDFLCDIVKVLGRTKLTAYLVWLAPRLFLTHKTLAPNGSMYVHCDPKASHYIKVMMDKIFQGGMFLNEIIWRRTHAHSSSRRYGPSHDVILFYSRGAKYTWNPVYQAYDEKYLEKYYTNVDVHGKYQLITCTAPGDRTGTRAHYDWRGKLPPPGRHWAWTIDQMEKFESSGRLVYSNNGVPRLKRYVTDGEGVAVQDIWTDIHRLDAHSIERVGFDTQKPTELLKRIILASSNEGDLVLDPFCGSGTTLVVAERLGRRWLGIDQSLTSCSLSLGRTRPEVGTKAIQLKGFPSTIEEALDLRRTSPSEFGVWGLALTACLPQRKLTSDDLIIGSGRLSIGRERRSLVGLIPMNTSHRDFPSVPKPLTRSTPVLLGHRQQGDRDPVIEWAAGEFRRRPLSIPLGSIASSKSLSYGIAPDLVRDIRGR